MYLKMFNFPKFLQFLDILISKLHAFFEIFLLINFYNF